MFTNPLEPYAGLSVDDLNRYLSAVRKVDEINMAADTLAEGVFLADAQEGLERIPDDCVDLIVTTPPMSPWRDIGLQGQKMTLQEYYTWNNKWLQESQRILRPTGSIYIMCGWRYSGMYHALLSDYFMVQTRITWRDRNAVMKDKNKTWFNEIGDIWLATKTNEFIFKHKTDEKENPENVSNLWLEYFDSTPDGVNGERPEVLLNKMIQASTYKLGWLVDPFMGKGSVGVCAKKLGRRFIGLETDQDNLLQAMKRIDQEN